MKKGYINLRDRAKNVRKEVEDGANTSERVGGLFEDIIDTMEEVDNKVYRLSIMDVNEAVAQSEANALEAKRQAELAKESGGLAEYAKVQGDYAKAQGDIAMSKVKDLSIQIARFNDKLFFRINAVYENGYIVLLRKKKQYGGKHTVSPTDDTKIYKVGYVIREFQFKNKSVFEEVVIDVSNVTVGVWTEFKNSILESLIQPCTGGYSFIGPVHANKVNPSGGKSGRVYLQAGLQYIIANPDYLNGVYENGKIPKRIIMSGEMINIKVYLEVKNTVSGGMSYELFVVPQGV